MRVILKNVRLSYPNLFKAASVKNDNGTESEPKFSASLILDKKANKKDILNLEDAIEKMTVEHFQGKTKTLKGVCLRDGEEKTTEDGEYKQGYGPKVMFVSASNKNRPQVVDRNPSIPITSEEFSQRCGRPYAGCYVNAVVSLWPQNNKYGRRINANLLTVQFVKDGDPFGEERVNPEEVFTNLEDDEDTSEDSEDWGM